MQHVRRYFKYILAGFVYFESVLLKYYKTTIFLWYFLPSDARIGIFLTCDSDGNCNPAAHPSSRNYIIIYLVFVLGVSFFRLAVVDQLRQILANLLHWTSPRSGGHARKVSRWAAK